MASTLHTDVAVIGAGTAGVNAFHELRRAGCAALLVDHGPLGTTCARVGCMPSKAALHAGHAWAAVRSVLGTALPADAAPDALWRHAIATRDKLAAGAAQRTRTGVGDALVMGTARFAGPDTLDVGGQRIRARAFVVATGSRPVLPDGLAALGTRVLTTDSVFDLPALPRSIGILGLGAIGLELGLAFSRLGVDVIAGDLRTTIAGIADPVVAARARLRFGSELTMWLGQPLEAHAAGSGVTLRNAEHAADVDVVLAALGRRPNMEGLALAEAGVPLDQRGQPVFDAATLRAGQSAVFFAGDVNPDRPLMHEAADEGVIAARGALALLGHADAPPPPRRVPLAIVFSDPDVASVGLSFDRLDPEQVVIGAAEGSGNGRSRILGAEDNLVRLYAARDTGRVLGASLLATHGEHLAHLLAWAVQRGDTVQDLLGLPYYHPSIEEMLQSALKDALRQLAPATA